MISEQFLITIVTTLVAPPLVLYIANRIKNKKPGDRLDKAIEIYENTIKRLDDEIKRKDDHIMQLQTELAKRKVDLEG